MSNHTERFNKPNGETTSSALAMSKAWKEIYQPIEKLTGWKCTAFDPGLRFNKIIRIPGSKYSDFGRSVEMTIEFANDLLAGIKNQNTNGRPQE